MAHRFRFADKSSPAAKARAKQYASKQHRDLRAAWQHRINVGEHVTCWRCNQTISKTTRWHLGHDDHDRRITRGPECVSCNLTAAARAGNAAAQRARQTPTFKQSQPWL